MPLAEGVSQSLIYKAYATGVITANTQPVSTTDPTVSGATILRRVASTLSLQKDTYQSNEIRTDRQVADFRHGQRRVSGTISGELSPASYFPFFEAVHRDTAVDTISLDESDLTSATGNHSASTWVFASGDPVALGLRVGDVIRFTNLSVAADNGVNFVIKSFGGTTNQTVTVTPAPTDQTADTAFTLTRPGKSTIVPTSGHVSRKFAIEHNAVDLDISRLFTECRASSYKISVPATGMVTCEFGFMGRDMEIYEGAAAPFFTSPTAASTSGIVASVNGALLVAGSSLGVITGLDIGMDLSPSAATVLGQNVAGEIFLGRAAVTGTVTAYFDSATLINDFLNESEVSLQALLTTGSGVGADAISIFMPRLKFGGSDVSLQGEGGQTISLPFTALLADGLTAGIDATTIRILDTAA